MKSRLFFLTVALVQVVFAQKFDAPVQNWLDNRLHENSQPPFSFLYNGKSSYQCKYLFSRQTQILDDSRSLVQCFYTYDKTLQIKCDATVYRDFPAVEWVLTFRNTGRKASPLISDIQALHDHWSSQDNESVALFTLRGSDAVRNDFAPIEKPLTPGSEITMGSDRGRSSDGAAFPFFNIAASHNGVIMAVGWTGQWKAVFHRNSQGAVELKAGMTTTRLKLHPNEEIRSPRILLLFWSGENRMVGQNLFRRFVLKHHSPQIDGRVIQAPFAGNIGPRIFDEFNFATEANMLAAAEHFHQLGLTVDYWWIDAGWYVGGWPNGVGNWFVKPDHFPRGLRPLTDSLQNYRMKLILWFEPERVMAGTWLDREHPDWILRKPNNTTGLLNLGNPGARHWLIEHIDTMIKKEGIALYRQDFNMDPLSYWRLADAPDRQGMTEIRHIEGLYEFWDQLLARNPGLIIDNCASGGRRLDLETASRSLPLWRTDYSYFEPHGYQCHTYGLNFFLPLSGTGNDNPAIYNFRSSMSSALVVGWNVFNNDFPTLLAKRAVKEYLSVRHFFYGDYYPLTEYSTRDNVWMAYQFHLPDKEEGMVLAFKRNKCEQSEITVSLQGLNIDAMYQVKFADVGVVINKTGKELTQGLTLCIQDVPGSLLVTYIKK